MSATAKSTRLPFLTALLAAMALLPATAASASAAEPVWKLDSFANTTVAPGGTIDYYLQVDNVGDANSSSPFTLSGHLPAGLIAEDFTLVLGEHQYQLEDPELGGGLGSCGGDGPGLPGASNFTCTVEDGVYAHRDLETKFGGIFNLVFRLQVKVAATGVAPLATPSFQLFGGGAATPGLTVDPTRITSEAPPFGIDAFDAQVLSGPAGEPSTAAGAHPYANVTSLDFNTVHNPAPQIGDLWPVEPARDAVVDLPPGSVGSTAGVERCSLALLANGGGTLPLPLCSPGSQVGTALIRFNGGGTFTDSFGQIPLYNMEPPPGAPARFGFNVLGTVVTLDAHLRSSGDYGLTVESDGISEGLAATGAATTFWGVPADEAHRAERACPGHEEPVTGALNPHIATCASPFATEPRAFLRNPTSCTAKASEGIATTLQVDSWVRPGLRDENGEPREEAAWVGAESLSHEAPGYPYLPHGEGEPGTEQGEEIGIEGCEAVPFEPEISAQPTTEKADSPSGLEFDLSIPQEECWGAKASVEEAEDAPCQSDLKRAEVTLPQGMSVNPSSASGLGSCTASEIGLITPEGQTPIHFNTADPTCPESSRIGTVKIKTPLIEEELDGSVYLAAQNDNPFKSLISFYIVAKAAGTIVKFPAHVFADPSSGQLSTVVDELPQLPFSTMHLVLFPGQRAALITPPTCGAFETTASLTPWSHEGTEGEEGTPIADVHSSFQIKEGPGGGACPAHPAPLSPKLDAGTQNPLAGAFSPFNLKLTREDGTQRLAGLDLTLPPGMTGKLAGIPYCPDAALGQVSPNEGTAAAQIANPSCPAASQVGTVTAGAGAGTNPFYLQTGKAYLAGPYKGAPLSLAVVTPALAGPFDLGNVMVRTALKVNPETAQIEAVSDPLPTQLFGIPLDLRDLRVNMDRPSFTLNPTSCNEMSVGGTVSGTEGGTANVSDRFQVGGCDKLGFKPKLSFRLKGGVKRGDNPAFSATLKARPGDANIARAAVSLPHSEFLDQAHIKTICTRVQFAADQCPAKSIYGFAKAVTPLLDKPLEGPVYLRSSSHKLPDLVADLNGQIHVVLDGTIDSIKGGMIRNRFEVVPDAPVSTFTLTMQGGKKGLLENSRNLCATTNRASVQLDAQNGKTADSTPPLVAAGCAGKSHKHKRRHH